MAFKLGDRIKQSTTSTSTDHLTLDGSITGYADFSTVLSNNDTTHYAITDGAKWEVGIGTFIDGGASDDTLQRFVHT